MNPMKTAFPKTLGPTLFAGMLLILLNGCGGGDSSAPTPEISQIEMPTDPRLFEGEPGKAGGRLLIATFTDPKTFNPITQNETSSSDIIYMLFEELIVTAKDTQKPSPGLVKEWSVAEDNKTWTLKLFEGLRWSDGHPLTTDDVVFTLRDVVYNTNIITVLTDVLTIQDKTFEIEKVDDTTFKVTTPEVYAPFVEFFGDLRIVPKHILEPKLKSGDFESSYGINTPPGELIGSGPFRLKSYKQGEITLLERNPYYHAVDRNGTRLPYLDTVVHMVVPDQNAMSLKFIQGEVDLHEFVRPDEYDSMVKESAKRGFRVLDLGVTTQFDMLTFNQNTNLNNAGKPFIDPVKLEWFRNTKFRQAISYAIDRESILKATVKGHGEANYGFFTRGNKVWYNPDIPTYPFNIEKARALLKEIGIEDRDGDGWLEDSKGRVIEFEMNTNKGNNRREEGSVIVQEDLKRLGIKVNYRPLDFNTLVAKLDSQYDFECILLGLASQSQDPMESMNVLLSKGFTHQWFPRQTSPSTPWEARIDELMTRQVSLLDPSKRKELVDEVQVILATHMPMIPTISMKAFSAVKNNVGNLKPTAMHNNRLIWNIEELYFTE